MLVLVTLAASMPAAAQSAPLPSLLEEIESGRYGAVTSLLVERSGQILLERYFAGADRQSRHDIRSATKSVTSLAIGIAIDRGLLRGVDEPVVERLPHLRPPAHGLGRAVTLDDLLTMRSGLACDDWVPASLGNEDRMYETRDWLAFWAALPRAHERGRHFSYCTGNVIAAAAMVERASGMRFGAFADRFLLNPLGVRNARWAADPSGATDAGGHLHLTSRDMLAVGRLVLGRGRIGNRRLVSEAWVERSTSPRTPVYERRYRYGYFWWIDDIAVGTSERRLRTVFAWGNGGNYIFVVPEAELVVVFTGRNYNDNALGLQPQRWMSSHVLAAFAGPSARQ